MIETFILSGQAAGMSVQAIANRFSVWHQTVNRIQRKIALGESEHMTP